MSSEAKNKLDELLSKDPSEMTTDEIKQARAALQLEKERLELFKLRRENKAAQAEEEEIAQQQARMGKAFEELRKRDEQIQSICTHRKGGTDTASLSKQGNDSNFSVIKHTGTFGETYVLCTRCNKLWQKSDANHGGKPTPGYFEALRYPTDNQPSSSVVFTAVPNFQAPAQAA